MKLDVATFIVVDCETTGLDPETDALVEVAAVAIDLFDPLPRAMFSRLVATEKAIPAEVSAVHGLTNAMLATAPDWPTARRSLRHFIALHENPILVAHNAAFDRQFLLLGAHWRWLCTKRVAMHIWPDAPNFKNQTLRYWRDLNVETFGLPPHRALGDALVTAALLRDQLASPEFSGEVGRHRWDVDEIIAWVDSPISLATWPFGKFFGQPIAAADTGYIEWALSPRGPADRIASDPDLKFTLERQLQLCSVKGAS